MRWTPIHQVHLKTMIWKMSMDLSKIEALKQGVIPIYENGLEEMGKPERESGTPAIHDFFGKLPGRGRCYIQRCGYSAR